MERGAIKPGIYSAMTGYLPTQEKIYKESAIPFVSVLSGTRTNFNRYDNAMWSGNVSNGLIDGKGVGFIIMPKGKYIKFEGTFSQGFPTSEVIVKSFNDSYK